MLTINIARPRDLTGLHAFLFAAGAICVGISPSGLYGYAVPVLASFMFTAMYYAIFSSRKNSDDFILLGFILLLPFLSSVLHSSEYDKPFWAVRDFARLIFVAVLFIDFSTLNYRKVQLSLGIGLLGVLGFDYFVLYYGFSDPLRTAWFEVAANNAFQEYVTDYYRHLGVMGNPNSSAAFYGITIFVFVFFEAIPAKVRLAGFALAVLLLFESQSRSHMLATFGSLILGLTAIKISRLAILIAGIMIAVYISLDVQRSIEIFWDRTEELSAFDQRVELIMSLLVDLDVLKLLLGDSLLPAVVDNDIVFFFLRFGLPVMIYLVFIVWRIMPRDIRSARTRLIYAFALFAIVGSLGGGIFGHPGLAFIYACIFQVFRYMPVGANQIGNSQESVGAYKWARRA